MSVRGHCYVQPRDAGYGSCESKRFMSFTPYFSFFQLFFFFFFILMLFYSDVMGGHDLSK